MSKNNGKIPVKFDKGNYVLWMIWNFCVLLNIYQVPSRGVVMYDDDDDIDDNRDIKKKIQSNTPRYYMINRWRWFGKS